MATGQVLREREILAGYEVELTRCAAYCLHYSYPLRDHRAFFRSFERDWAVARTEVHAGGKQFHVAGRIADPTHVWHPPSSRQGPSFSQIDSILEHAPPEVMMHAKQMFEAMLNMYGFVTPGTSRVLRSTMTVYQESGTGTCWLAAALNVLLHVPETRVPLLNALSAKRLKMDDATLSLFASSPLGERIFNQYKKSVKMTFRDRTTPSHLDAVNGGFPDLLMKAFRDILPTLRVLKKAPENAYASVEYTIAMLWKTGDPAWAAVAFVRLDAEMREGTLQAVILGGKSNRGSAHAVAIARDSHDPHRANVYNHGISGREQVLYSFYKKYHKQYEMYTYTFAFPVPLDGEDWEEDAQVSARRRLRFANLSPPTSPRKRRRAA